MKILKRKQIIVALDFNSIEEANLAVKLLDPEIFRLKIGKQLFAGEGPKIIENFNNSQLEKITIITGYKSNKFKKFYKIDKIKNKKWKTTNIFGSLIHADRILSTYECIISYADIFYEQEAIEILKKSKTNKGIVVLSYKHWKKYWKKRFKKPLSDLEVPCFQIPLF